MWTVIVSPSTQTVARVMPPPSRYHHVPHKPNDPVRPQPDLDAVDPHINWLDQRLHDPRLFGGEELVPEQIKLQ